MEEIQARELLRGNWTMEKNDLKKFLKSFGMEEGAFKEELDWIKDSLVDGDGPHQKCFRQTPQDGRSPPRSSPT